MTQISTPEKRKRFKAHYEQFKKSQKEWTEVGYKYGERPEFVPLPYDLENMQCGAKTKATGRPCKRKDIYENGRCKLHAGLSTGPITAAGKKKSALNGFKKGWRKQKT